MKDFKVVTLTTKEMLCEARHNFVVTFWYVAFMSVHLQTKLDGYDCSAEYQPYWRQYLKQYETDNTDNPSHEPAYSIPLVPLP
jgi:hypothetical protein